MRIDAFNKISQLYQSTNVKNTAKTKSSSFSDMLEISQAGKGYQVTKQAVSRTPDVRENIVGDIKRRMELGTYDISMEQVADKLVDSYFNESV